VQGSERAIIDWSTFDIAPHEHVAISQPSTSSILLNRIGDQKPSEIFGTLSANGQVILSNPNGFVFGATSRVDVGGLIATTSRFPDDAAFLEHGQLVGQPGNNGARILQEGQITAREGGLVALVAPEVRQSGVIVAQEGRIQLSGAEVATYDLYGDGLLSVAAPASGAAHVEAGGTLTAIGGTVLLSAAQAAHLVDSAVNITGVVEASGLIKENGVIVLAGEIAVTGDRLTLQSGSQLNADGPHGGGTVHVGGGWQGAGPLPWAKTVDMQSGAKISASATDTGHGGEAVLWSKNITRFEGSIRTNAGLGGGNGGRIETSGLKTLIAMGDIETFAGAGGLAGTWLLDPANLTIQTAGGNSNILSGGGNPLIFDQDVDITPSIVAVSQITNALDAGTNVIVQTDTTGAGTGNITVANAITTTGSGALTLSAFGSIFVNSGITLQGGDLTLRANNTGAADGSTGTGIVRITAPIATNGGNVTIGGGTGTITAGSGFAVGLVTADNSLNDGVRITSSVNAGGGNIIINGRGGNNAGLASNHGIAIDLAAGQVTTSGNVTLHGIGGASGTSDNYGVRISNTGSLVVTGGNVTINATGGEAAGGRNYGMDVNASGRITNNGGNILINATGGLPSALNTGIHVRTSGAIEATGNGNITLQGTGGGSGSGTNNDGIRLDTLATVSTVNGLLDVYGLGGNPNGSGAGHDGIQIAGAAGLQIAGGGTGSIRINATGGGNSGTGSTIRGISIDSGGFISGNGGAVEVYATGGGATGNSNNGISLSGTSSRITNTGNGGITLRGTGGGSDASGVNHGVSLASNAFISTLHGLLDVQGLGGNRTGTGSTNRGVSLGSGGNISITTGGNGSIRVSGIGGGAGGGSSNPGVLVGSNSYISALGGSIEVSGTGGIPNGSSNHGIDISGSNARIINSGVGNITLRGTGGGTLASNDVDGVRVVNGGSVSVEDGTLSIIGQSGIGTGAQGVLIARTGTLNATGTGDISVQGHGSGGVEMYSNSSITSNGGSILLSGTGRAVNSNVNYGIDIRFDSEGPNHISTNGNGTITLNGTGGGSGDSQNNYGVQLSGGNTFTTQHGLININGTGGIGNGTSGGILIADAGTQLRTLGTGNIILNGAAGQSSNHAIEITTADAFSALAGSLITLNAANGNIAFTSTFDTPADMNLTARSLTTAAAWGDITRLGNLILNLSDAVTLPAIQAATIFARTQSTNITLGGILNASSTTGTAVTLAAGKHFLNPSHYSITTGPGARWLIYSDNPSGTFLGTPLTAARSFERIGCFFGGSCTFPTIGNGVLYRQTPPTISSIITGFERMFWSQTQQAATFTPLRQETESLSFTTATPEYIATGLTMSHNASGHELITITPELRKWLLDGE
jgi:filamentous hemagglutinin family protein